MLSKQEKQDVCSFDRVQQSQLDKVCLLQMKKCGDETRPKMYYCATPPQQQEEKESLFYPVIL